MRDIVSGIHVSGSEAPARAASASAQQDSRVHLFAIYGAFALIAAIVFGTLSFRPF